MSDSLSLPVRRENTSLTHNALVFLKEVHKTRGTGKNKAWDNNGAYLFIMYILWKYIS